MRLVIPQSFAIACILFVAMSAASLADSFISVQSQSTPHLRDWQEAQDAAQASLRQLSNTQLMQEYDDPGHLVSLAPYRVLSRSAPFPGSDRDAPYVLKYLLFGDIKREIRRRGAPMVPLLADFLEGLLPKKSRLAPTQPLSGIGCWYDTETIDLLVQIRVPQSAQVFLRILASGKDNTGSSHRDVAEDALGRMTYCCYYQSGRNLNSLNNGLTVPQRQTARVFPDISKDSDYDRVAAFYRQWLNDEGKDSSQWLPLARHRAHLLLATDDPVSIKDAALFLTYARSYSLDRPHDDAPVETLERLGEIASQVTKDESEVNADGTASITYLYKGVAVPPEVGDLSQYYSTYSVYVAWYKATARHSKAW